MDFRDNLEPQDGVTGYRLFPYAKDLYYHPSGILSMTIELYNDIQTEQFTFGFNVGGNLKVFLDKLYTGDTNEERD